MIVIYTSLYLAIPTAVVPANFTIIYDNPHAPPSITCNRTPSGMFGKVALSTDSGLYLTYECDYFDAPIFADTQGWSLIRQKMAYCVLNQEILFWICDSL